MWLGCGCKDALKFFFVKKETYLYIKYICIDKERNDQKKVRKTIRKETEKSKEKKKLTEIIKDSNREYCIIWR